MIFNAGGFEYRRIWGLLPLHDGHKQGQRDVPIKDRQVLVCGEKDARDLTKRSSQRDEIQKKVHLSSGDRLRHFKRVGIYPEQGPFFVSRRYEANRLPANQSPNVRTQKAPSGGQQTCLTKLNSGGVKINTVLLIEAGRLVQKIPPCVRFKWTDKCRIAKVRLNADRVRQFFDLI